MPEPVTPSTSIAPEALLVEQQIEAINRFPDQNPNPVMRITHDGHLLYANAASEPIRLALGVEVAKNCRTACSTGCGPSATTTRRPPLR